MIPERYRAFIYRGLLAVQVALVGLALAADDYRVLFVNAALAFFSDGLATLNTSTRSESGPFSGSEG